jgi:hypothetical protein
VLPVRSPACAGGSGSCLRSNHANSLKSPPRGWIIVIAAWSQMQECRGLPGVVVGVLRGAPVKFPGWRADGLSAGRGMGFGLTLWQAAAPVCQSRVLVHATRRLPSSPPAGIVATRNKQLRLASVQGALTNNDQRVPNKTRLSPRSHRRNGSSEAQSPIAHGHKATCVRQ